MNKCQVDGELGKFVGWMKIMMGGDWTIMCSGSTKLFVAEVLNRLKPLGVWSECVILKNTETPICSIMLVKRKKGSRG